jgi:hypothetical protein
MEMIKRRRPYPMHRINTRIRQDQEDFIKFVAKKTRATEGEVFRAIID